MVRRLGRPFLFIKTSDLRTQAKRATYLDGLRGFAALLVYLNHYQFWAHQEASDSGIFSNALGYDGRYYFACLPGIRLFFTGGHVAVAIFFMISGYALSYSPLKSIHEGEPDKLWDQLASAFFRRWIRLYVPVISTTVVFLTMWHLFHLHTALAEPESSLRAEFWRWYIEFKNLSFVFRTDKDAWFTYNFHVWSIPVEFRGSIIVFTSLAAFSRCTRNARLICEFLLTYYLLYLIDNAHFAMFMAGMLLCDIHLLADKGDESGFFTRFDRYKEWISLFFFVFGLYLAGIPSQTQNADDLKNSPGWSFLYHFHPSSYDYKWFYLFWAGIFVMASIPQIPWLKSFFEMRFNQYLGRISYSLYLIHGPVLWVLGDWLYAAVGWVRDSQPERIPHWVDRFPISKMGPLGLELSFLIPQIILFPVTLVIAEFATKMCDDLSVKFSKWLYGKAKA